MIQKKKEEEINKVNICLSLKINLKNGLNIIILICFIEFVQIPKWLLEEDFLYELLFKIS